MILQIFDIFFKSKIWNLGLVNTHILLLLYCVPCKYYSLFFYNIKKFFVPANCMFFRKLNRNMIFLVVTLLRSFVAEFCSLKQFPCKHKNYLLVGSYCHNVYLIFMGTCFHNQAVRWHEVNPGPKPNPCHNFLICHWNLDILTARNYLKVPLLLEYGAVKKFLMLYIYQRPISICLTYLMMKILIVLVMM